MEWFQAHFTEIFNGVLVLGMGVLAWIGQRFGARTKSVVRQLEMEPVELAGAVIDNRMAEELADAFRATSESMDRLAAALDANTEAKREGEEAQREATKGLDRLEHELRELTQETIRAGRRA